MSTWSAATKASATLSLIVYCAAGLPASALAPESHAEAFDVWERTSHSRAYHTLEIASKNFNLSCVGCHVTGYQRPGGAEVVQNDGRRDVQCESCHGLIHPPQPVCNHCRSRELAIADVSGIARLIGFTLKERPNATI